MGERKTAMTFQPGLITDFSVLKEAAGPFVWRYVEQGLAFIVGGAVARLSLGHPIGEDIDVATSRDIVRHAEDTAIALAAGQAGGSPIEDPDSQDRLTLRTKVYPSPNRVAIDWLGLRDWEPWNGGHLRALTAFVDTFDAAICQQVVGVLTPDGPVTHCLTMEALTAIGSSKPGWRNTEFTSPDRRAKWDELSKGRPVS